MRYTEEKQWWNPNSFFLEFCGSHTNHVDPYSHFHLSSSCISRCFHALRVAVVPALFTTLQLLVQLLFSLSRCSGIIHEKNFYNSLFLLSPSLLNFISASLSYSVLSPLSPSLSLYLCQPRKLSLELGVCFAIFFFFFATSLAIPNLRVFAIYQTPPSRKCKGNKK